MVEKFPNKSIPEEKQKDEEAPLSLETLGGRIEAAKKELKENRVPFLASEEGRDDTNFETKDEPEKIEDEVESLDIDSLNKIYTPTFITLLRNDLNDISELKPPFDFSKEPLSKLSRLVKDLNMSRFKDAYSKGKDIKSFALEILDNYLELDGDQKLKINKSYFDNLWLTRNNEITKIDIDSLKNKLALLAPPINWSEEPLLKLDKLVGVLNDHPKEEKFGGENVRDRALEVLNPYILVDEDSEIKINQDYFNNLWLTRSKENKELGEKASQIIARNKKLKKEAAQILGFSKTPKKFEEKFEKAQKRLEEAQKRLEEVRPSFKKDEGYDSKFSLVNPKKSLAASTIGNLWGKISTKFGRFKNFVTNFNTISTEGNSEEEEIVGSKISTENKKPSSSNQHKITGEGSFSGKVFNKFEKKQEEIAKIENINYGKKNISLGGHVGLGFLKISSFLLKNTFKLSKKFTNWFFDYNKEAKSGAK